MSEDQKKQHEEFDEWLDEHYQTLSIDRNSNWYQAYDAWYRYQIGGNPQVPPPPPPK